MAIDPDLKRSYARLTRDGLNARRRKFEAHIAWANKRIAELHVEVRRWKDAIADDEEHVEAIKSEIIDRDCT